jgi:hypothetical protein
VSGDPADIGHAGEPVIGVDVEDVFQGEGSTEQIAARRVHETLGFARGAGRLSKSSETRVNKMDT